MPDVGKLKASCNKNEGWKIWQNGSLHLYDRGRWIEKEIKKGCNNENKHRTISKNSTNG